MTDAPLAVPGLTSYRYRGPYGWVMIGATDHDDALREARRSITGPADWDGLQIWDEAGGRYVSVEPPALGPCPMCGGPARFSVIDSASPPWQALCDAPEPCVMQPLAWSTRYAATKAWNRRAVTA